MRKLRQQAISQLCRVYESDLDILEHIWLRKHKTLSV